jgi:hypothetical protein
VRRFLRENSLTLAFGGLLIAALVGQALVGHALFDHDASAHHGAPVSLGRYLTSSSFGVDVMENWQSEYLQFTLYALLTVWFVQRGSAESKPVDQAGVESDADQKVGEHAEPDSPKWAKAGGWRTALYSSSLALVMGGIWLATWAAQLITGRIEYNANQLDHHLAPLALGRYLGSSDFWDRTLQNWQSEFLAVASFAVFTVYLRQRGSPESKPVGASHEATGETG